MKPVIYGKCQGDERPVPGKARQGCHSPPVNKVPPGLRQRSNLGVGDDPIVIVEVKIVVKGVEENSRRNDN